MALCEKLVQEYKRYSNKEEIQSYYNKRNARSDKATCNILTFS